MAKNSTDQAKPKSPFTIRVTRKGRPTVEFTWHTYPTYQRDGAEYQLPCGWYYQARKYLYRICWVESEYGSSIYIMIFQPRAGKQSDCFLPGQDLLRAENIIFDNGIYTFRK